MLTEHRSPFARAADALVACAANPQDEAQFDELIDTTFRLDSATGGIPLARLAKSFGLSAFECDVVALVGLPEEHENFGQLARRLHPAGEARLTFGSIAAALELDASGRSHLRRSLHIGPLHEFGIVKTNDQVPLPEASLSLPSALWSSLRGFDAWPLGIEVRHPATNTAPAMLLDLIDQLDPDLSCIVSVTGGPERTLEELTTGVSFALTRRGLRPVCLPAVALDAGQQQLLSLHLAANGCVPVLLGAPPPPALAKHAGPVFICADRSSNISLDERPLLTLDLGSRSLGESTEMWSSLMPELNGAAASLAGTLRVDPLTAGQAIRDARLAGGSAPIEEALMRTVRHRTDRNLPESVRPIEPSSGWESLVTSPANRRTLESIVHRLEGQVKVLSEWGFGTRSTPGVRALFAGPPGTGKTLSAEVIAKALGLDLLVVDLSSIVSKWLGETEKNLSEVFNAAERCQSVLFFDEADAIFARRTSSGDAQGRWANLETAHLLNRIDAYGGVCVLATNLRNNIDEAFIRRLDFIVEFDEPDAQSRLALWESHLPDAAPLCDSVNLSQLANLYPLTGGLIRNAAVAAAFHVARSGRDAIDQRSLLEAVEQEYQKAGRSFPGLPKSIATTPAGGT